MAGASPKSNIGCWVCQVRSGLAKERNCVGWGSPKSNVVWLGFAEKRSWQGWDFAQRRVWLGSTANLVWLGFTGVGLLGFNCWAQRRARWTWSGLRAEFWCAATHVLRFRLRFVCHPVPGRFWAVRWPSLVLSGPVWSGPPRSGLVKSSLGPAQSLRVQSCRVWSVQPWPVWSGLAQSSPHVISATTRKYTQAGKPMAGHTCCKCDQVRVPPHPRQFF